MSLVCARLAGVTFLATFLAAQTPLNEFGIFGSGATLASRNNLPGTADGDLLQGNSSPLFNGVGQISVGSINCRGGSTFRRFNGFRVVIQDEDASTQENYSHVLVDATPAGIPDVAAPDRFRLGPLTTPSGTGRLAWSIISDLATPADPFIRLTGPWFYGVGLTINSLWPADGASVDCASSMTGTAGDNAHPMAPNAMYTIDRTAGTLTAQPTLRSSAMFLRLEAPVLLPGQDVIAGAQRGPNPSYGWGGVYPYLTRPAGGDGVSLQVRDLVNAGGVVGYFLATDHQLFFSLCFSGVTGGFWLRTPFVSIGGGTLDAMGVATNVVAPQGSLPPLTGQILYQAFTADSSLSNLRLTHQCGQCFL